MDSMSNARKLLVELLEPDSPIPNSFYKILLLGIRDAYEYHRELLAGGEGVDKMERIKKYYDEGLRFWRMHDRERGIYYLGGALYHLQDAWLGLAEDPAYEAYLEERLGWRSQMMWPEIPAGGIQPPEKWVEEALRERDKIGESPLPDAVTELDPVSLELSRRAEAAGAGLLLQFFVEAPGEAG